MKDLLIPITIKNRPAMTGWTRSISLRRIGFMVLIMALVYTLTSYILQAGLNYPTILVDGSSLASTLVAQSPVVLGLGVVGLLFCGVLQSGISFAVVPYVELTSRQRVIFTGSLSGILWAAGALILLILAPLWASSLASAAQIIALFVLLCTQVLVPLLLIVWTTTLTRQFHVYKWISRASRIGLPLISLRSICWIINAIIPVESRFYGTAGILSILALLGESVWLVWLILLGVHLTGQREVDVVLSAKQDGNVELTNTRSGIQRRSFIKRLVISLFVGIVGGAFLLGRSAVTIASSVSIIDTDAIPAEPSLISPLIYGAVTLYLHLSPIETVAQMRAANVPSTTPLQLPSGTLLQNVNASGIPAQIISAPGATTNRAILYVHGGGFSVPLQDQDRVFAAQLSQATGAIVLLPEYRLSPEQPFPAGLNDCVVAYRWLQSQGASKIVIIGGSAGGNLSLAIPLVLRGSGEALPAAVITMSAPTDLTMTGDSYATKAAIDPVLGNNLARNSFAAYTNNGAVDVHNPLVSPLYGDLQGFPPTLLQVGTQEVLLSDAIRMADRLRAAGAEVKLEIWPGMFHGWQSTSILPEANLSIQHIIKFMRQYLI